MITHRHRTRAGGRHARVVFRRRRALWVVGVALLTASVLVPVLGTPRALADVSSGSPEPAAGTGELLGVACPTANTCYAVGDSVTGENATMAVVTITDGVPGTPQAVPPGNFGITNGSLEGVACASATTCYAVGAGDVGTEQRGIGMVVPITDGVPGNPDVVGQYGEILLNAACPTSSTCYAVGGDDVGSPNNDDPEVVTITDGNVGAQYVSGMENIIGIECSTAITCLGEGESSVPSSPYDSVGSVVPITDGVAGTVQEPADADFLDAGACPTASTCEVVGEDSNNGSSAVWTFTDGVAGNPQGVAQSNGGNDYFSVGCTSSSACAAVGYQDTGANSYLGVVPITNGVPGTPEATSSSPGELAGVACPPTALESTSTTCEAVGHELGEGGVVEPITISSSSPPSLSITAVTVQEQNYPNGNWEDLPISGAVAGNQLQINVTVQNNDTVDHDVAVAFTDTERGGIPVPQLQGPASTDVPAGGSTTITYAWDTTGLAWDADSSVLDPLHRLALTLLTGTGFTTVAATATKNVVLEPEPIVFVHGLLSSAATWATLQAYIASAYPGWQTFAIDTMNTGGQNPLAPTNTIAQNAQRLATYIQYVRTTTQAQHVDIVAHSMGGLISRQYIQDDMPDDAVDGAPVVTHLAMLGTPNEGSPCATLLPLPFPAAFQNTPAQVAIFNSQVTNQRGVAFSVLAGTPVPTTCLPGTGPGDGAVEVTSALYIYSDTDVYLTLLHTSMTSSITAFESWVKPHLIAVPASDTPADAHAVRANAEVKGSEGATERAGTSGAAIRPATSSPPGAEILALQNVTIPVGQSTDVSIPVSAPTQFGATFLAPGSVSAQLIDPSASTEATAADVTSTDPYVIHDIGPITSPATGTWTLELTNDGSDPATALVSAWEVGDPLSLVLQSVQADAAAQVEISTQMLNGDTPVSGATVTASFEGLGGETQSLNLTDTGNGIYSATSPALAPDSYQVVVDAVGSGFSRTVTGSVEVAPAIAPTPSPPASPPAPAAPPTPASTSGAPAACAGDTGSAAFVCAAYEDLLGRAPDAAGLAFWSAALARGTSHTTVATDIAGSPEYRNDLVTSYYRDFLGRSPDQPALAHWDALLGSGEADQGVLAAILGSKEFYAHSGGTPGGFVSALYHDLLGRLPDPKSLTAAEQHLGAGLSRTAYAQSILASNEYRSHVVQTQYLDLLGRPVDLRGLLFWVFNLRHGSTYESVISNIVGSPEFSSHATGA
jgi:pimeloyl-ACP methyl ester carboxylesterase